MSEIEKNLRALEDRIATTCTRAGRARDEVRLIAVTKTRPPIAIAEALSLGVTDIGENRVQEAAGKFDGFRGGTRHLIGSLQSNKARKAVQIFDSIQTIDSDKLATRVGRIAEELGRSISVLIQVNVGGEAQKSGVDPDAAPPLAELVERVAGVTLEGLMTVPPIASESHLRGYFSEMRDSRARCSEAIGRELRELSMGMSDDFEIAIEEGATMIRVGRAIFGERT